MGAPDQGEKQSPRKIVKYFTKYLPEIEPFAFLAACFSRECRQTALFSSPTLLAVFADCGTRERH